MQSLCLSFLVSHALCRCNRVLLLSWPIFSHKFCHIKFSLASIVVHVTDFAKHGPLTPTLIMYSAHRPHTACKKIRKNEMSESQDFNLITFEQSKTSA